MAAQITKGDWLPLPGALPDTVDPNSVYVIPTRGPESGSDIPRYTEVVRYLPKEARAAGLPIAFSRTSSRQFLSEYSVDAEMWSLGIACMQMANEWLILTVSLFIGSRAKAQGWSDQEARELPLKVYVAETETGRNYEIEGTGTEVLEALKFLQQDRGRIIEEGAITAIGQEEDEDGAQ